jgi:hypothetical protein
VDGGDPSLGQQLASGLQQPLPGAVPVLLPGVVLLEVLLGHAESLVARSYLINRLTNYYAGGYF